MTTGDEAVGCLVDTNVAFLGRFSGIEVLEPADVLAGSGF